MGALASDIRECTYEIAGQRLLNGKAPLGYICVFPLPLFRVRRICTSGADGLAGRVYD